LKWQCNKGHIWDAIPSSIKRGGWCPYCAHRAKLTIEEMQKLAESKGGKCLSKNYVNANNKLKWQCKNSHVWEATPSGIIGGHWCPKCSHIAGGIVQRSTLKNMQDIANAKGGRCLSEEYTNSHALLRWQCKEGHEWCATPHNIKAGKWCPKCGHKSSWEKRRLKRLS